MIFVVQRSAFGFVNGSFCFLKGFLPLGTETAFGMVLVIVDE